MMPPTLRAIFIKTARRGPMLPTDRAEMQEGRGLVGNANQGGRRQVTILEEESWERAMEDLAASLPPQARRANLLVRGIRLPASTGRILRIGAVRIRILGETKPCPRMDEALEGLKDVLKPAWGGGAYGEVLSGGPIATGDVVEWEAEPHTPEAGEPPGR